jgi:hypothetical protein
MNTCWECGCEMNTEDMREDLRIPPLDEDNCLCLPCHRQSSEEAIEALEQEIVNIKEKTL